MKYTAVLLFYGLITPLLFSSICQGRLFSISQMSLLNFKIKNISLDYFIVVQVFAFINLTKLQR